MLSDLVQKFRMDTECKTRDTKLKNGYALKHVFLNRVCKGRKQDRKKFHVIFLACGTVRAVVYTLYNMQCTLHCTLYTNVHCTVYSMCSVVPTQVDKNAH